MNMMKLKRIQEILRLHDAIEVIINVAENAHSGFVCIILQEEIEKKLLCPVLSCRRPEIIFFITGDTPSQKSHQ